MRSALITALLFAVAAPAAAADSAITIRDPARFRAQMAEMGYAPDAVEPAKDGTTVTFALKLKNETLAVVLAGCKAGRDCDYVALVGSFTDVTAPLEWIAKVNADYDLIKVWKRDDGRVGYASSFPVEGIPRAAFRAWVDGVTASTDALGLDAIKAGYGPKQ